MKKLLFYFTTSLLVGFQLHGGNISDGILIKGVLYHLGDKVPVTLVKNFKNVANPTETTICLHDYQNDYWEVDTENRYYKLVQVLYQGTDSFNGATYCITGTYNIDEAMYASLCHLYEISQDQ